MGKSKTEKACFAITFDTVEIIVADDSQPIKKVKNCTLVVDCASKRIYLDASISCRFKDVENLMVEEGCYAFFDCRGKRTMKCMHPLVTNEKLESFRSLMMRTISKRQAKPASLEPSNNENAKVATITPCSNARAGRSRRNNHTRVIGARGDKPPTISNNSLDEIDVHDKYVPPTKSTNEKEILDCKGGSDLVGYTSEYEKQDETGYTPQLLMPEEERRRLRKRIAIDDRQEESDADVEFDAGTISKADLTTPSVGQRVVSPLDNNNDKKNNSDKRIKSATGTAKKRTLDSYFEISSYVATPANRSSNEICGGGGSKLNTRGDASNGKATNSHRNNKAPARSGVANSNHALAITPKIHASPLRMSQNQQPFFHSQLTTPAREGTKICTNPRNIKLLSKNQRSILSTSNNDKDIEEPAEDSLAARKGAKLRPSVVHSCRTPGKGVPYKGLRNLGNTCYLNACLQMIYTIEKFVETLRDSEGELARSIVSAGQELKESSMGSASAKIVKVAIDKKTDRFEGYSQQRDAHECLSYLVDAMHDEIVENQPEKTKKTLFQQGSNEVEKSPPTKTNGVLIKRTLVPTDDYFRCDMQVRLTCQSCGYSRTKEELYRHISLDIPHHKRPEDKMDVSVQNSLEQFFKPEEREIICDRCSTGRTAKQTLRLLSR